MQLSVNNIRAGLSEAIQERIRNERMKADLITNVSHDIKTPLTSIVNYVDLLKRENLENENARNYIRVLDEKSQRLKQLTEDLVEASKISSGNIQADMQTIDLKETPCTQTDGLLTVIIKALRHRFQGCWNIQSLYPKLLPQSMHYNQHPVHNAKQYQLSEKNPFFHIVNQSLHRRY